MSEQINDSRDVADAKAWFYLDHRGDIETWKGLRSAGRDLLDKHLVGAIAEVEQWAEELGAEPDNAFLESGSLPRAGLRRSTWLHDGLPDVSIAIEWERARLLTPGSNEWPYIAVRLPADSAGDERRRQVNEAMKPVRAQLAGQSSRNFPFWRYIQSPASGRLDPDELAQAALAALRELWTLAAPILDTLHASNQERRI